MICWGINHSLEVSFKVDQIMSAPARAQWKSVHFVTGGCGFDPRPSHTNDFKIGTSCTSTWHSALLKSRTRTGQLSFRIMWLGGISCLGLDISVRQHSKSEHWAPCHIQTPLGYDWKIVESDVKPKSNKQNKQIMRAKHLWFINWLTNCELFINQALELICFDSNTKQTAEK